MRVRIAATVSQSVREIQRDVLEQWLELSGKDFDKFVGDVCGWKVEGDGVVKVPMNKENEAKSTVVRENVKFDRRLIDLSCITRAANTSPQNSRGWFGEHTSRRYDGNHFLSWPVTEKV